MTRELNSDLAFENFASSAILAKVDGNSEVVRKESDEAPNVVMASKVEIKELKQR
jgi:hypothetical protein